MRRAANRGSSSPRSSSRGGAGSAWTSVGERRRRSDHRSGTERGSRSLGARAVGGLGGGDFEGAARVIPIPQGCRVWLATGHTDMRKGFDGLALVAHLNLEIEKLKRALYGVRSEASSVCSGSWNCSWRTP